MYASWSLKKLADKPIVKISKEESAFNFDSQVLSIFSLGQRRLLADIFWISTLLESDLEHIKKDNDNSWMFLRFKTISDLDPLFFKNYLFGGQYLNIIKDDLLGSEKIFDKGLKFYPESYDLNFHAGFLQAFELKNYSKAVLNYEKIKDSDRAPSYLKSLLVKLKYSKSNDLELARKLIKDILLDTEDKVISKKLQSDLYAIQAQIDLNCLNSKGKKKFNCALKDLEGNRYIKKGGKYTAPKPFKNYNLFN